MKNVIKQVNFAKINTRAQIEIQIQILKNQIIVFTDNFETNICKKTATILSNAKAQLIFLNECVYYTKEAQVERNAASLNFNLEISELLETIKKS
jgi:hypothetical protein